jgi:hypothetical protein
MTTLIRLAQSESRCAPKAGELIRCIRGSDPNEPPPPGGGGGSVPPPPSGGWTTRPPTPDIQKTIENVWGYDPVVDFKKSLTNHEVITHAWQNPVSGKWEGGNAILQSHMMKPIGYAASVTIRDCIVHPNMQPHYWGLKWGIRAFDVKDWVIENSIFKDIPEEHGNYFNAIGNVTWRNCLYFNIGSQAIQVVFRPDECLDPSLINAPGLLHVDKCITKECGKYEGTRPSFALSFFPTGQDVLITNTTVETLESFNPGSAGVFQYYSFGAVMAHFHPVFRMEGSLINYKQPNRSVIQLMGNKVNELISCHVTEGEVEINQPNGWEGKSVKVQGCTGGAILRITEGPLHQPHPGGVIYEGPITAGYSH